MKSPAHDFSVLYSLRTGKPVGRVTIVEEFAGPKRKTAAAILEIDGNEQALPTRFANTALEVDDNPLELLK